MKKRIIFVLALVLWGLRPNIDVQAQTEPAVQAILFYSPSCPHCHLVINDLLVPMQEQYGAQLQILGVDTTKPGGSNLFVAAMEYFGLPADQMGVPTLVVADTVLNGSLQIPEEFPGIVEAGLAAGGIGWPDIPGLRDLVPDLPPSAASEADADTAVSGIQTGVNTEMASNNHPVDGAWLAWVVMALMIAAILFTGYHAMTSRNTILKPPTANQTIAIILLVVAGLIVAGYLAYIETTQSLAVCGPVGDCNSVQASDYAIIIGIPIAILGLINYLAVGLFWFVQGRVPDEQRHLTWLGLMALTFFGTIFSIYLTALELFVIRAVCAWCLSSAVITTLLMLIVSQMVESRKPVTAV